MQELPATQMRVRMGTCWPHAISLVVTYCNEGQTFRLYLHVQELRPITYTQRWHRKHACQPHTLLPTVMYFNKVVAV